MQNSVLSFIQYVSREETEPITGGEVQQWFDVTPGWVQTNLLDNLNLGKSNVTPRKGGIMITSVRMLYQIFKWCQEWKRFDLHKIEDYLMHMLEEMDDEGTRNVYV